MLRRLTLVILTLGVPSLARADIRFPFNYSAGPVLAIGLDHDAGVIFGIEGGVGKGPERINLGFEHRRDHDVGYVEVDPWLLVGATFGVGVDEAGSVDGIVGLWEGYGWGGTADVSGARNIVTVAAGWRYTGVHELFLTVKGGRIDGTIFPPGNGQ